MSRGNLLVVDDTPANLRLLSEMLTGEGYMCVLCQMGAFRQWMRPDNHDLVLNAAVDLKCSRRELVLEKMLLRLRSCEHPTERRGQARSVSGSWAVSDVSAWTTSCS